MGQELNSITRDATRDEFLGRKKSHSKKKTKRMSLKPHKFLKKIDESIELEEV